MSAAVTRRAWALNQEELEDEVSALMAESGPPATSVRLARMMAQAAFSVGVVLEPSEAAELIEATEVAHRVASEVLVSSAGSEVLDEAPDLDSGTEIPRQGTGAHDEFTVELLDSHLVVASGGLTDLVRCPDGLVALLVDNEALV